jgi:hypothetical protein
MGELMTRIFCAFLFAIALAVPASAKTYNIPESNPLISIEAPDAGWEVKKIERGIDLNSDDDEVYLAIEGIDKDNASEVMGEAIAFLSRSGVKIDSTSEKRAEGKLNGLATLDFGWTGTDKDGDVVVHLTIVKLAPGKAVLFTYWASPEGDKKYDPVTGKILSSLKPVVK